METTLIVFIGVALLAFAFALVIWAEVRDLKIRVRALYECLWKNVAKAEKRDEAIADHLGQKFREGIQLVDK